MRAARACLLGFVALASCQAGVPSRSLPSPDGVGSQPWICGMVVPSPGRALGFHLDPDTVAAAQVVAEGLQIPIDLLKNDPQPQPACPAGVRIELVVPAGQPG